MALTPMQWQYQARYTLRAVYRNWMKPQCWPFLVGILSATNIIMAIPFFLASPEGYEHNSRPLRKREIMEKLYQEKQSYHK